MKKHWIACGGVMSLTLSLLLAGCGQQAEKPASTTPAAAAQGQPAAQAPQTEQGKGSATLEKSEVSEEKTLYVRMDMKSGGSFVIELAPDAAPETVENFQNLVAEHFYDGLTFHRAVPSFVIQGGDPKGDGTGGSSTKIKGEFLANGHFNPLKHKRGVLSMARSQDPNSASSQFFIVLDSRASQALNDRYAAFGQVIYGMQEADRIAQLPTRNETLVEQPVIEKAYFITEKSAQQAKQAEPAAEKTAETPAQTGR